MLDATGARTTPDWLRQRAFTTPDRLALLCTEGRWDFAGLDRAADRTAGCLQTLGLGPDDRVALLSGNSAGFVRTVHAAARLGAVLTPLNTRLTPAELAWQLRDAGATWLLHDNAPRTLEAASSAVAELPKLRCVSLDGLDAVAEPGSIATTPDRPFDLDAVQTVVYTSGTTGQPKGAMLTYGNHLWSAVGSVLNLGLLPADRWLACLPLFHVGGLSILLRSVLYGIPVVLHDAFDPQRVNRSIDADGVTIVSVVATMLQRMLDARGPQPYPPTLRCVLLGGGPAPEPLLRECERRGVPVVQTYGLTETASQLTTLAPEDALRKLGSAGKPLFGSEVRVLRDDGSACDASEAGEIVVRGPTVTPGYLNRPEDTARALRDGWLHTGDIGRLDAEGYLYVLDRRDDLIVSGGENVYPAEVEAALAAHPDVVEAGVHGVDHALWGRAPAAVVVRRPGATVTEADLIEHCRGRLARYKTPVSVSFANVLPRNAAGKLLRRELGAIDGQPSENAT